MDAAQVIGASGCALWAVVGQQARQVPDAEISQPEASKVKIYGKTEKPKALIRFCFSVPEFCSRGYRTAKPARTALISACTAAKPLACARLRNRPPDRL